jgi:hypothetical protein
MKRVFAIRALMVVSTTLALAVAFAQSADQPSDTNRVNT